MTEGIAGRVAVVTGAADGIGRAIAEALAAAGARVSGWDIVPAPHVDDVVDVSDSAGVDAAFDAVEQRYGPVRIVAHAAGVLESGPVRTLTDDAWERCMRVNAAGTMYVTRRAAAGMAGGGAITVVASNAAATPRAEMAAYAASKAAARAFVRSLGLEVAADGVRCNIVSPGSTDTAMLRSMWRDPDESSRVIDGDPRRHRLGIPLQRLATPEDVAAAVVFLSSAAARHITLHDLRVDGGATLDQ